MKQKLDTFRNSAVASDAITLGVDDKLKGYLAAHQNYIQGLQGDITRTVGSVKLETAKSGKAATDKAMVMVEKIITPLRFRHDRFKEAMQKEIDIKSPLDYLQLQGWQEVIKGMKPSEVIEMIDEGESSLGRAVLNLPVLRMSANWKSQEIKSLLLESTTKQLMGEPDYLEQRADFETLKTAETLLDNLLIENVRYNREHETLKAQTVEDFKPEKIQAA